MEMLKKERWGDTETREERISLSLLTCGPQKPWFKGPTPLLPSPNTSHHPHLNLPAHCGLFCEFFLCWFSALAQQGKLFVLFWTSSKGSCLACSEWTHKPWEGEWKVSEFPPMHMNIHTLHLYIQNVYTEHENTSSLSEKLWTLRPKKTKGTAASSETYIRVHQTPWIRHFIPFTRCLSSEAHISGPHWLSSKCLWSLGDPACLWSRYQIQ